jgi:hypothetical protein
MTRSIPVFTRGLVILAGIFLGSIAARGDAEDPKEDEFRRKQLEFMTERLDGFVLSTEKSPDKALPRTKEPVLRFSNPTRGNAVGAIFLWLSGDRPVAVAALRIRPDGGFWREFTSLGEQPLVCKRGGKMIWSPQSGVVRKPLPDAPKPAATPASRLVQMRRLAERFSVEFDHLSAMRWEELRLLPQPIYRYTADKGAVEGAIFALAQSNDPEALLIVELKRPPKGEPVWEYALARASSQRMRARLDDKDVWTVSGYWSNPRSRDDPYQEAPDGKFPGAGAGK